ncbi:hypothetical protein AAIR98_001101 [Elusimicrobium simillimum]|uniref:hypothetical protein n=1 Tax=Elusimicrobium simillimum TaxID=3143438 RepID=UPI003C7028E9
MEENTEETKYSPACEKFQEDALINIKANCYNNAMSILVDGIDNANYHGLTDEEKEYLTALHAHVMEKKKQRDGWGLTDGQALTPVKSAPPMFTWNGIGTKVYGNTLYLVLIYIPVLPIGRYAVEKEGYNSYYFHGKLKLTKAQKIWLWVGLAALFIALLPILKAMVTGIGSAIISKF